MTQFQNVLITGGSGGIGSAAARHCAAAGAWPLVGYCGRADRAQSVVEQCGRGEALKLDLRLDDFGSAGPLPRVDAVVHNAALFPPWGSLLEMPDEDLRTLIEVNLLGPIRLVRALLESDNKLSDIVFILSTASFGRGGGPYALSKIGELAACKQLAAELASSGTRVNAIAPGWTETRTGELAARALGCTISEISAEHLDGRILAADEVGELCARILFDSPPDFTGHMAVWDRRESVDPVWMRLESVFSADELPWTKPATMFASISPEN